jgi:hypothetical protein
MVRFWSAVLSLLFMLAAGPSAQDLYFRELQITSAGACAANTCRAIKSARCRE